MFQLGTVSSQREAQMLIEGGDTVFASPNGFKYHVIRNSTTINVLIGGNIDVLIVGGGGGGGHGYSSGGGGAGGVLYIPSYDITPGSYSAIIGEGGNGAPSQGAGPPYGPGATQAATAGQNTTFLGFTAFGGGRGGSEGITATDGGSGGGAGAASQVPGAATQTSGVHTLNNISVVGYGNSGGPIDQTSSGGGGGAGAVGTNTQGGIGIEYQSYALFRIAGGGHAIGVDAGTGVNIYGAGTGGRADPRVEGQPAASNTGSGGGGGARAGGPFYSFWTAGGKGGSGVIIIKYPFISY